LKNGPVFIKAAYKRKDTMIARFKHLIVALLSQLRIRNPIYFMKKKILRRVLMRKMLNSPVQELALIGAVNCKAIVENEVLDKWIKDYGLDLSNILPSEGNLAFPFFNEDVLKLLVDSKFSSILEGYFINMYGCRPVLQSIPYLVISYPNISHGSFDPKKNNFPAHWHTDYQSEFTVHVPLGEINSSCTHTVYAVDTHTSFFRPPSDPSKIKNIFKSFCGRGDAVMLDVDGWHHGHLEGSSPRLMVQFKFTKGNDLLNYPEQGITPKARMQIERTKNNIHTFDTIKRQLRKDMVFSQSISSQIPMLAVIEDNIKYYHDYI